MAPLQKRALITLVIGLVITLALIVAFIIEGDVTAFSSENTLRYITYVALIGVPVSYLVLIDLTLRKPAQMDERDRLVLLRAGKVQWLAVALSLATWTIALTQGYRDTGAVPAAFIPLIFISILIISILAQCTGILIGYWRMNRNA